MIEIVVLKLATHDTSYSLSTLSQLYNHNISAMIDWNDFGVELEMRSGGLPSILLQDLFMALPFTTLSSKVRPLPPHRPAPPPSLLPLPLPPSRLAPTHILLWWWAPCCFFATSAVVAGAGRWLLGFWWCTGVFATLTPSKANPLRPSPFHPPPIRKHGTPHTAACGCIGCCRCYGFSCAWFCDL